MSASMEVMPPGGHETYATSIFSKIKTYLDSNPYKPVKDAPNTPTAIATFDDGSDLPMPKLEVAIEPQQDLHGYDSPWVGGAGKNKLNLSTRASATVRGITSEVKADNTIVASGTSTGNGDIICPVGTPFTMVNGETYTISLNGTDIRDRILTIFIGTSYINISSINSGAHNLTFTLTRDVLCNQVMFRASNGATVNINAKLQIEKGSTATSYAPYSNICPISRWDEAVVSVSGINVWDEEWEVGGISISSGQDISLNAIRSKGYSPCKPSTAYHAKFTDDGYVFWYDADKNYIGNSYSSVNDRVVQSPYNAYSFRIRKDGITTYNNDISINYPSTDTSYHVYNGQTYTIDLDGTRYGGTLDVVSGVLTVDRGYMNLGTYTWQGSITIPHRFRVELPTSMNIKKFHELNTITENVPENFTCSQYVVVGGRDGYDGRYDFAISGSYWNGYNQIQVNDMRFTDATAFKTAMDGVQLVYELANPQTYQLTPTQVKSLLGQNNVWADTGDVLDAEYIRDMYDNITAKYAAYAYNSGNANTASKLGSSNVGSATQPIYLSAGTATACTYTLGKSVPSDAVFTDTKNTAGSTDTSSKLFLIGATSQAANPRTYSQDTAYVGTDGCLYSGGTKVLTAHQDISGKADKSATVSTVTWSNNKLTKTINGTTSDVVSASDILDNLTSSQVTTALGYVPGPSYSFESSDDSIDISSSMVPGEETINLKLNSVSWNNISGKPSTFTPAAHDHTYIASAGSNTQSTSTKEYALGAFNVRFFSQTGKLPGQPTQYGFLLTAATGTNADENHQIFMAQADGNLYHRGTNGSSSSNPPAFKTILDSSNYTSYTRNSSGVIKVNSVTKTPTNAGTSLASPKPLIDSGYKFLCWLYVQSNGYIVGANYPGGAANPSATWWFANGYLANYALTFYYLEIKDTI